ncbi:MAG: Maf family nucleotide pyrophosphatase [Cyclobacteriaceae bacterium]
MKSSNYRLILASNSPRRQELLRECGFDFEVFTTDVDESFPADIGANHVAKYLANKKNKAYQKLLDDSIIITADTTVVFDKKILNKPSDDAEAFEMINQLSGKKHFVITGVCISSPEKVVAFDDITEVEFKQLTEIEINNYISNYRPFDKAGAYGIQEWIGMIGVEKISGSYFNVMGLPTHQVYEVMKTFLEAK